MQFIRALFLAIMILLPEMEQETEVDQQTAAFGKDVGEPDALYPDDQRNG